MESRHTTLMNVKFLDQVPNPCKFVSRNPQQPYPLIYPMQVNFYIKTGMFLLFLVFSGLLLPAQIIGKITGTVQDEDGKGFPDISLRLGRESVTMSNSEGSFSLRIPAGKENGVSCS